MNYEHLLVTVDGPITTITLNRPEKRNALALGVMQELTQALHAIAQSDALGVILAANGPVFSAGHNCRRAGPRWTRRGVVAVCTDMMNAGPYPNPWWRECMHGHGSRFMATCDLAVAADTAALRAGGKAGLFCRTPVVAVSYRPQTC